MRPLTAAQRKALLEVVRCADPSAPPVITEAQAKVKGDVKKDPSP